MEWVGARHKAYESLPAWIQSKAHPRNQLRKPFFSLKHFELWIGGSFLTVCGPSVVDPLSREKRSNAHKGRALVQASVLMVPGLLELATC